MRFCGSLVAGLASGLRGFYLLEPYSAADVPMLRGVISAPVPAARQL